MNKKYMIYIIMMIVFSILISCGDSSYKKIKFYIDDIKVIDTHSHQGMPWRKKHNCFDSGMYLHADLISAGMPEYPDSMIEEHDAAAYWDYTEKYLRFCRGTSYYTQFVYNYKVLYGLEENHLTKADFVNFSGQMDGNFKNYPVWLDSACQNCNIDLMFADRLWQAFDTNFDTDHFRYVFRFDQLVLEGEKAALAKKVTNKQALELIGRDNVPIPDLRSYLQYIDLVLEAIVKHNVVCLKMGLAYHRSLDFKIVQTGQAEKVFKQKSFSDSDVKLLQDYLVSYIVRRAVKYDLPVQIHTGYLHGNRGYLDRGHPMKLLTLIRANPKTRFVLFHGGFPWTGDFMILGKCYPNVYLDIVWLPQLSRTAAVRTLHEILDCVPYNKICWGGDVGNIDDAAGSLELGREVVATVLAERMDNGWITEEIARDIARRIFRENAIDIYDLKNKGLLDIH